MPPTAAAPGPVGEGSSASAAAAPNALPAQRLSGKAAYKAELRAEKRRRPRHTMYGDVAILPPRDVLPEADVLAHAEALLQLRSVRSVAVLERQSSGEDEGRRVAKHVAGDPDLRITYKESGVEFRLDLRRRLSRLNKAQGSCDERLRISRQVREGERILVLGSGIGLTACLLGKLTKCGEVVGVDTDSVANEFAVANVERNRLAGRVESVVGDPFAPPPMGVFDRVCAFLPWQLDGVPLPLAEVMRPGVSVLSPGGVLHCYSHESQEQFDAGPEEANRQLREVCGDRAFELTWRGKVPRNSIGRNWYRIGMDFTVS